MANQLENLIVDTAARAARAYLDAHGLTANTHTLAHCIREACNKTLPDALRDAGEALAARMNKAACSTFLSSFVLAGIDAAKVAGFPREHTPGDHIAA